MPTEDPTRPDAGEPGPGGGGTGALTDLLSATAGAVRDAEVPPGPEECEALLSGCNTVFYEVEGLAERIREATGARPTVPQVVVRLQHLTRSVSEVPIDDVDEAHELTANLRKFFDVTLTHLEEWGEAATGWS